MPRFLELAREAERVGVDSVWVAEYWATTRSRRSPPRPRSPSAAAGHGHRPARGAHPAMLAMTAQGSRRSRTVGLILGIGASGPQSRGLARRAVRSTVQRTRGDDRDHQDDPRGERLGTTARCTSCRCLAGRAGRSDHAPRPRRPRYVASLGPPTCASPRSRRWLDRQLLLLRRRPTPSSARSERCGQRGTLARRRHRVVAVSPRRHRRTTRTRSLPLAAATPTGPPSRSAPWARRRRTSTTTRSSPPGYGDDAPRCNASGRRATVTRRRHACRSRSALGTNLIGPPRRSGTRLAEYGRSGCHHLAGLRRRHLRREGRRLVAALASPPSRRVARHDDA